MANAFQQRCTPAISAKFAKRDPELSFVGRVHRLLDFPPANSMFCMP
jgi:hypothetical protein